MRYSPSDTETAPHTVNPVAPLTGAVFPSPRLSYRTHQHEIRRRWLAIDNSLRLNADMAERLVHAARLRLLVEQQVRVRAGADEAALASWREAVRQGTGIHRFDGQA